MEHRNFGFVSDNNEKRQPITIVGQELTAGPSIGKCILVTPNL